MGWKDLDIKLKAELIKLGVRSGVRDLKLIRLLYDLELENDSIKTLQSSLGYNEELKTTPEQEKNNDDLLIEMLLQEGKQINAMLQMLQTKTPLFNTTTGDYNNQLPVLFRLFKNGGPIEDKRIKKYNSNSAGYLYDSFVTDNLEEGENPHNSREYTISEELAEKLGYYRDEISGHRDDAVKLPDHPSHSSRGTFKDIDGYHIFDLTDKGANDVNYTISGLIDNGDDHVIPIYKGSYMLPEVTVTPDGNYVHDTYNNLKWHSNNSNLSLVGKVKKYSKGGYENPDEPPVSESTNVELSPLNIYELELLNYLLSNPTAEQEYFRDLAILNMTAPQSNLGVIQTKEEQDLVDKAFLEYNNFRYSHPWAEGLGYTPVIGDAMDLISIAGDVNNKNYMRAGLGLGMMALPNFIEKHIKKSNLSTLNNIIENATQQSPLQEKMIQQMYADELLGKGWSNKIALKDNKKYLQPIHVNLLDDQVLKRMRRNNFQKDSDIEKIKRGLRNIPYYEYPKEYFDKAGYPTTSGWYLPWDNRIIHNIDVPSIKVLPHEYRHLIDLYYPLNSSNKIYLNRAYKDYFKNLNLTTKDGFDSDISDEMVTTNLEARMLLFEGNKINQDGEEIDLVNAPLDVLDRFILNATKEEILDALRRSNLYGYKFVQFLKNKGDEYIEQKLPYIREALYKVPAIMPFGLMSHKMFNQNNKEENKNGGFIFPNYAFSHKFEK